MEYRINGGRLRTSPVQRVARRRALRLRERRLLRRVPRHRPGCPRRRHASRCGSAGSIPTRASGTALSVDERATSRTRSPSDTGNPVLVLANEDYTGVNPEPTPTERPPRSTSTSTSPRSTANGVTRRRVGRRRAGRAARPRRARPLQRRRLVLRRQPPDPGPRRRDHRAPVLRPRPARQLGRRARSSTSRWPCATSSTRAASSSTPARPTAYSGLLDELLGGGLGGIYYGLDGAPEQPCVVDRRPDQRLPPAGQRLRPVLPRGVRAHARSRPRASSARAGPTDRASRRRSAGRPRSTTRSTRPAASGVTSDVLPPDEFPSSRAASVLEYAGLEGDSIRRSRASSRRRPTHLDDSYMRLGRTFDLTGGDRGRGADVRGADVVVDTRRATTTSSSRPTPSAPTTGRRCPTSAGARRRTCPQECEAGFLLGMHP